MGATMKGLVVQVFVLCATSDSAEAIEEISSALNGSVFESTSVVRDFVCAPMQTADVVPETDYVEGSFLHQVPGGLDCLAANSITFPS